MTTPLVPNGTAVSAHHNTIPETSKFPAPEKADPAEANIGVKEPEIVEFADLFIAETEAISASEVKPTAPKVAGDAKTETASANDAIDKAADASDQDKVASPDTEDFPTAQAQQGSSRNEPSQPTAAPSVPAHIPKHHVIGHSKTDQPKLMNISEQNLKNSDGTGFVGFTAGTSQTEAVFNAQDKNPIQTVQKNLVRGNQTVPTEAEISTAPVKLSGASLLTRPAVADGTLKMPTPEGMAATPKQAQGPLPPVIEHTGQRQSQTRAGPSLEAVGVVRDTEPSAKMMTTPENASLNSAKSTDTKTSNAAQTAYLHRSGDVVSRQDGPLLAAQTSSQFKVASSVISPPATAKILVSGASQNSGDPSLSLLVPSDAPESMTWDHIRTNVPTQVSTAALRAELAPQVARQIGEAMGQASNRPIEIALSPKELGRVHMSVVAEDGTVTINIMTERPETLDLMRRHIDQLGQTLRNMGYDSINFAFGQGTKGNDASDKNPQHTSSEADTRSQRDNNQSVEDANPIMHVTTASTQGVDIRL